MVSFDNGLADYCHNDSLHCLSIMNVVIIPLTRGLFTVVNPEDYDKVKNYKWFAHKGAYNYYAATNVRVNGKRKRIFMHRLIMGVTDRKQVHHKDVCSLNNTNCNLEVCSQRRNLEYRHGRK
jgi:hypothetical protein